MPRVELSRNRPVSRSAQLPLALQELIHDRRGILEVGEEIADAGRESSAA